MPEAKDVASRIINLSIQIGEPITNMKLQKLLYYSYCWYLIENKGEKRLFNDEIQAWKYGPVVSSVYELYKKYKADVISTPVDGNESSIDALSNQIIEDVFKIYGDKTAIELMNLSRSEKPWRDTFDEDNQNQPIPDELIYSYYSSKLSKL